MTTAATRAEPPAGVHALDDGLELLVAAPTESNAEDADANTDDAATSVASPILAAILLTLGILAFGLVALVKFLGGRGVAIAAAVIVGLVLLMVFARRAKKGERKSRTETRRSSSTGGGTGAGRKGLGLGARGRGRGSAGTGSGGRAVTGRPSRAGGLLRKLGGKVAGKRAAGSGTAAAHRSGGAAGGAGRKGKLGSLMGRKRRGSGHGAGTKGATKGTGSGRGSRLGRFLPGRKGGSGGGHGSGPGRGLGRGSASRSAGRSAKRKSAVGRAAKGIAGIGALPFVAASARRARRKDAKAAGNSATSGSTTPKRPGRIRRAANSSTGALLGFGRSAGSAWRLSRSGAARTRAVTKRVRRQSRGSVKKATAGIGWGAAALGFVGVRWAGRKAWDAVKRGTRPITEPLAILRDRHRDQANPAEAKAWSPTHKQAVMGRAMFRRSQAQRANHTPGGGPAAGLFQGEEPVMLAEANEPDGMLDFGRKLEAEGEAAEEHNAVAQQWADMAESELPLNPAARDAVRQYAEAWSIVAEMGAQMATVFGDDHADDMERLESPRVNEQMWDASANDL